MNNLAITGFLSPEVSIDPKAIASRDALVAESKAIARVDTDLALELAASILKELRGLTNSAEESRRDIKEPVLKLGKAIDAAAREYSTPVDVEIVRVSRLVGDYTEAQRRAAAEVERKRQVEIDRIERERVEAENVARRLAEQEAMNAKTAEEAQAAAVRAEQERQRIATEAAKETARTVLAPAIVPLKAQGVSVGRAWKFEVTDINELHRARPDLVDVTPATARINAAIKGGTRIAGLKVWVETKVGVRA